MKTKRLKMSGYSDGEFPMVGEKRGTAKAAVVGEALVSCFARTALHLPGSHDHGRPMPPYGDLPRSPCGQALIPSTPDRYTPVTT